MARILDGAMVVARWLDSLEESHEFQSQKKKKRYIGWAFHFSEQILCNKCLQIAVSCWKKGPTNKPKRSAICDKKFRIISQILKIYNAIKCKLVDWVDLASPKLGRQTLAPVAQLYRDTKSKLVTFWCD